MKPNLTNERNDLAVGENKDLLENARNRMNNKLQQQNP